MNNIDHLVGGSMSDIRETATWIVKSYSGGLARGHQKLIEEHRWLSSLPRAIHQRSGILFPDSRIVVDSSSAKTELYIRKLPKITISKAIHCNAIDAVQAGEWADCALGLLFAQVYPIRSANTSKNEIVIQHARRLAFARGVFEKNLRFSNLCNKDYIVINGLTVMGLNNIEEQLLNKFSHFLRPGMTFAIHGNLHFDNILIEPDASPHHDAITFIDPRGDLLGPLHYDSAKLMTSAHSYYDEIHYGYFEISRTENGEYLFSVRPYQEQSYKTLLEVGRARIIDYAALDKVTVDEMLSATLVCEALHTFSFAAYHASRTSPNHDRVEAYLLIAALLADKAMRFAGTPAIAEAYVSRLLLDHQ